MFQVNSGEVVAQHMTGLVIGSASIYLEASSLVGGKNNLERSDSWGKDDSTCADGNLAGEVQAIRGLAE